MSCPKNCETCKSGKNQTAATIRTLCMKLNACIVTRFILVKLVGQLARALIKEHLTMNKQTIYKHIESIDILYTLDSASNYSAIQKLKP